MSEEILFIAILGGMTVFVLCLLLAVFWYDYEHRLKVLGTDKRDEHDWLFSNFSEKVYDLFYSGKEPEGTMYGINVEHYERQCRILHREPKTKTVIARRLEGLLVLISTMVLTYFALQIDNVIAVIVGFSGAAAFYILYIYSTTDVSRRSKNRLEKIKEDLPRYVVLLEKAMDLPIEQALRVTSEKFESPLSSDLIDSFNEAALGVSTGWQGTLVSLAKRYDIDSFSSFVLDIINAYEQGIDIREAILRKQRELEEERIYDVQAHDSKIKTIVFIPVIVFKLIPVAALICLPMLMSVQNGF